MKPGILQELALGLLGYGLYRRFQSEAVKHPFQSGHSVLGTLALLALGILVLLNPELISLGFLGDAAFADLLVLLIGIRFQAAGAQVRAWVGALFSPVVRCFKTPRMVYLGVLFGIAFENLILELRHTLQRMIS